jgi:Bifunctional DNA primase/polymerase, N-terminal
MVMKLVLGLIAQGLPCFPCHPNKRPATPCGYKDGCSDPAAVQELWRSYPGPLSGVPTGQTSGLDVLDIDPRNGGDKWFSDYTSLLQRTRVHQTRGGGLHLLFQHKAGLRCSIGGIAAGVDVRADGGYIIWWPGVGLRVISELPIAPWPSWLAQQLSHARREISPRITIPDDRALVHLIRLIARAREGERNKVTFWAACRAGEMVASGMLQGGTAAALIAEAATRSGLPRAEAERTARSGIRTTGGRSHA